MKTQPQPQAQGNHLDPAALVAIKSLELRARVIVEGFWTGLHRSPFHGFSVEFTEYRQYTPGDDPRYLDWRLFARSDRFYIKKFEDETNLRTLIVLDTSASMDFGSGRVTKADYARTMAATLAYFIHQQGDAVGLLSFDEHVRDYLPPKNRGGQLRQLFVALDRRHSGKATAFAPPLKQLATVFRKRGMVIMISDFLSPIEELERGLTQLQAMGHDILLIQVLDPREQTFDFENEALFKDLETEQQLFVTPAQVRETYIRTFQAHQGSLDTLCARAGVDRRLYATNEPMGKVLHTLLQSRSKKERNAARAK